MNQNLPKALGVFVEPGQTKSPGDEAPEANQSRTGSSDRRCLVFSVRRATVARGVARGREVSRGMARSWMPDATCGAAKSVARCRIAGRRDEGTKGPRRAGPCCGTKGRKGDCLGNFRLPLRAQTAGKLQFWQSGMSMSSCKLQLGKVLRNARGGTLFDQWTGSHNCTQLTKAEAIE